MKPSIQTEDEFRAFLEKAFRSAPLKAGYIISDPVLIVDRHGRPLALRSQHGPRGLAKFLA